MSEEREDRAEQSGEKKIPLTLLVSADQHMRWNVAAVRAGYGLRHSWALDSVRSWAADTLDKAAAETLDKAAAKMEEAVGWNRWALIVDVGVFALLCGAFAFAMYSIFCT